MIDPQLLERFTPLDGLSLAHRRRLAAQLELRTANSGDVLFRIGDPMTASLYLVDGCVQLRDDFGRTLKLRGSDDAARHALAPNPVRKVDAVCVDDCRYLAINAELLDVMLTWDQGRALEVGTPGDGTDEEDDVMVRLLQLPIFHRVPPSNLYGVFKRLEIIDVAAGQTIVRQDEPGDYFYVIVEGHCSVTRTGPTGAVIPLAALERGSCFGEEALISDEPRNATVTMLAPGRLMRLAKQDFRALLNDPLARPMPYAEGAELVASGRAQWLDVRLPAEFRTGSLSRSVNIPLHLLRLKLAQLDKGVIQLAICDTGRRSSVAAWLLNQRGFEAYRLESGLPAH